jgi:glycosyltransferase involved in cell wall biosynthesis
MPARDLPVDEGGAVLASGLVSVIIPAFNVAPYLSHAVRSALAQSHRAIEVIVIDDGSTDATGAVMARLAAADPRVTLIQLGRHSGVSAARNAGLRRARGEWIALLDADDQFLPGRITTLLDAAHRLRADLIADNLQLRDFATGATLGLAFPAGWMDEAVDITVRTLLERDIAGLYRREIGFIKPLIRRQLLVDHKILYREDVTAGEDLLFYVTCLRAGGRLRLTAEAHYLYSMRSGSISSSGAANIGCRRVNEILQGLYEWQDPAITALLGLRAAAIDYELFLWHLRGRRLRESIATARKVPPKFLAAKLVDRLRRRLGLAAANPAALMLKRLIEDQNAAA